MEQSQGILTVHPTETGEYCTESPENHHPSLSTTIRKGADVYLFLAV